MGKYFLRYELDKGRMLGKYWVNLDKTDRKKLADFIKVLYLNLNILVKLIKHKSKD
jgi:hypothetical protein